MRARIRWGTRRADGPVLVLHDTTELNYTGLRSIADLGSIGSNLGRGSLCHNSLAYDPQKREVLGLANQILHVRELVGRRDAVADKRARTNRESRLWTKAVAAIGATPSDRQRIHVADRSSDMFEQSSGPPFLDTERVHLL